MKNLLILLLLLLFPLRIFCIDLNFKYYQVENGLSSNTVYDIIQDSQGFIWIATEDGLNRFDGYDFRYFRNVPRDTTSIVNNYVYCLLEDAGGELWIGTEEGICIYNLEKETFSPFTVSTPEGIRIADRIQNLLTDEMGRIWIGANKPGIFLYDKETKRLKNYPVDSYGDCTNPPYLTCLYRDRSNDIWASVNNTRHQIYKLNKSTDSFEPAFPGVEQSTLKKLSSYSMVEDMFGTLWLGTWNNGLYALDKKKGIKGHYLHTENKDKTLHIHSITEYAPGHLLIGANDGLTSFTGNPTMGYKHEMRIREPVLSSRFVYPIYKDKEGGLWIGTYYGGINYASPNRNYFTGYTHNRYENSVSGNVISVFCEDKKGNLWIGTDDGGLNYFDTKTEHFTVYKPEKDKNSLSFHNIHALCIDDNELWIGTYTGGLNVMNLETKRFRHYYPSPEDTSTLSSNSIYSLYKDTTGNIWVGTMEGINLYDRQADNFIRICPSTAMVLDILQVRDRIWFATNGDGIYTYNLSGKEWKHYSFRADDLASIISNQVICFCMDAANRLWIGTNKGLCRYEEESDAFTWINTGFESDAICNIFADDDYLWITTTRGLIEYDHKLNRHRSFSKEDGLTGEQFTLKSGIRTASGKIYAGTTNGFNAFYPKQITTNRKVPQIAVTEFQLFNQTTDIKAYIRAGKDGAETVVLPYNKNSFGFDFTALSFFAPEKNEYAFMLEGFDKYWNYVGKKRKATYTNIPPGNYLFKVRASNNDGIWNNEGISLRLTVTPPFWKTNWFILLYLLAGVSILIGLLQHTKRKNERKKQEEIEKIKNEQEKEAYDSKINFFTAIAHEIRTPVSLIIGPLEQIICDAKELPGQITDNLNVINRNSQRLLSLVNQLLDFRKIEKGTMPITYSRQNIHELLAGIYIRFKPYVVSKNISFVYTSDTQEFITMADAENLTKVISNLLNNAAKFTKDAIGLTLQTNTNEEYYRITVKDNGAGIAKEEQEKIFKPFYQSPDTRTGGTGIGLYLVQSLVNEFHGTLLVESEAGQGSSFTITLPAHQAEEAVAEESVSLTGQTPATETVEEVPAGSTDEEKETDPAEKQRVMIVEDNEEMLAFLKKSLRDKYHIVTAGNGMEGLWKLEKEEVDIIISDVMMPGMDGVTFCRRVKDNFLWSHIPFILLTAKTNIETKIEALGHGADAYVEKPFSMLFLQAQIKNLLESRKHLFRKFTETPYSSLKSIAGNKADEEFLSKMNEVIEQNISNVDFNMEQLAERLNISSSGLFSKIKALSGSTPNRLLLLMRLKKATELLNENKYRINEVCYMVGFNNPSYFAKCFQKQYGVLPKEFIKEVPLRSEDTEPNENQD